MIPTITRKICVTLCRSGSFSWTGRLANNLKGLVAFLVFATALFAVHETQAQCIQGPCPGTQNVNTDANSCFATLALDLPTVDETDPNCVMTLSATNGATVIQLDEDGCNDATGFSGQFDAVNWFESGNTGDGEFQFQNDNELVLETTGAGDYCLNIIAPSDGYVSFDAFSNGEIEIDLGPFGTIVVPRGSYSFEVNGDVFASGSNAGLPEFDDPIGGNFGTPLQASDQLSICIEGVDYVFLPGTSFEFTVPTTIPLSIGNFNFTCQNQAYGVFPVGTSTVTYTNSNDVDECTFNVTVTDNQAPVIYCTDANDPVIVNLGDALENSFTVGQAVAFVGDNCDDVDVFFGPAGMMENEVITFGCDDVGTQNLTVTARNTAGNISDCTLDVLVVDDAAPSLHYCPNDRVEAVGDNCESILIDDLLIPSVNDGCLGEQPMNYRIVYEGQGTQTVATGGGLLELSGGFNPIEFSFPGPGVYTVFFGYADPNEMFDPAMPEFALECSYTITIVDTEAPVVAGCADLDQTVSAEAGLCGAAVDFTEPTASDNCDGNNLPFFSRTHAPDDFFPVGVTTVTYVFVDDAGNAASCEFTVTVTDDEAPTVICPEDQFLGSICDGITVPDYRGSSLPSDNCGVTSVTQDPLPGTAISSLPGLSDPLIDGESFVVTITVSDGVNTDASCEFTVTLQDNDAPIVENPDDFLALRDCNNDDVINMFDNLEFGCIEGEGDVVNVPAPIALDCNGCEVAGSLGTLPPGILFNQGVYDDATCTWTTPPSYDFVMLDLYDLDGDGTYTFFVEWLFCDELSDPNDPPGPPGNCNQYQTLTYEFMMDSKDPLINAPADVTLYTGGVDGDVDCDPQGDINNDCVIDDVPNLGIEYFDPANCVEVQCMAGGPVYPPNNLCPDFFADPAGDVFGGRFTDNCCIETVRFRKRFVEGCNKNYPPFQAWEDNWVEFNVNGGDASAIVVDPNAEYVFERGLHEIEYQVIDCKGNTFSAFTKVTIDDNETPDWVEKEDDLAGALEDALKVDEVAPADAADESLDMTVVLDCNSPSFLADLATVQAFVPMATDECTLAFPLPDGSQDNEASCEDVFNVGGMTFYRPKESITKFWEAFDQCGNSLTDGDGDGTGEGGGCDDEDDDRYSLTYITVDNFGPRWDPDYDVDGDGLVGTAMVPSEPVSCDEVDAGDDATVFNCTTEDTLMIFVSEYDSTLCEVALTDELFAKAVDCTPENMIEYSYEITSAIDCYHNVITELEGASDESTGSVNAGEANGGVFPVGEYTIVYTATDMCGLTSTYTFDLKVVDDIKPEWQECPEDITAHANAGVCATVVTWDPPFATDNCNGIAHTSVEAFDELGKPIEIISAGEPGCVDQETFAEQWAPGAWVLKQNGGNGSLSFNGVDEATEMYIENDVQGGNGNVDETDVDIIAPSTGAISFTFENITPIESDLAILVNDVEVWNSGGEQDGSTNYLVNAGDKITLRFTTRDLILSDGEDVVTIENWEFTCTAAAYGYFPVGHNTVRYIAEDFCGMPEPNVDTCEFKVIVEDTQDPWAACVDEITLTANSECKAVVTSSMVDNNSDDNCKVADVYLSYDGQEGEWIELMGAGTYTIDLIVEDKSGNQSTCQTTVTVVDDTAPVVDCSPLGGELTKSADAGACSFTMPGQGFDLASATDNCDADPTIVNDYNNSASLAGESFPVGGTVVNWTVTDAAGNETTCSYEITVTDDEAPAIVNPGDQNAPTTANDNTCGTTVDFTVDATDSCGVETVTATPASGSFFPVGTTVVTITATDIHGNTSTETFNVNVTDGTDPVVQCSDVTLSLDVTGNLSITPEQIGDASDNCGVVSFTADPLTFDCSNLGPNTVTLTATDAAGNVGTCEATVTVTDYTADYQVVFCPADVNEDAPADACEKVITQPATPQVQQGCSGPEDMTFDNRSDGLELTDAYPVGTTAVTWTFTTLGGQILTCQYNVVISDVTAPTIAGCPPAEAEGDGVGLDTIFVTMQNQGQCGAMVVNWTEPTATDFCSNPADIVRTRTHAPGSFFGFGSTLVTYTFTDEANNTAVCEFVVTVIDTIRPELPCNFGTVITQLLGPCGKTTVPLVNFGEGNDNCGIEKRCVKIDTDGDGVLEVYCEPDTQLMIDCNSTAYCDTAYLWYWIEDKNGNVSDTCDISLTVIDTIKPLVCTPIDSCIFTTINEKDSCHAYIDLTIPFVACDTANNAKPTCGDDPFFYDNDTCNLSLVYEIYNDENCDGPNGALLLRDTIFGATDLDLSGFAFPVGRNRVVLTAYDKEREHTDEFYINVIDTLAPFAEACPYDATIGTNQGQDSCFAEYEWVQPKFFDNCSVDQITLVIDYPDGACLPDGSPLNDTTITILDGAQAGSSKACPDLDNFTWIFPKGETKLSYVVSDYCENVDNFGCGDQDERNTAELCHFTVTVEDETPVMVMDCPGETCDDDGIAWVYLPTTVSNDPDTCVCYGELDTKITFKENCDTLTITKYVYDLRSPVPAGPNDTEGPGVGGGTPPPPTVEVFTYTKGDKDPSDWKYHLDVLDTLPKGDWKYRFVAEDCGGFTDSCVFNVRVYDNIEPEILDCPADTIYASTLPDNCFADVCWDIPMFFEDNCKVLDTFYWSVTTEDGGEVLVKTKDPDDCINKVDFTGPFSPEFWTQKGDPSGNVNANATTVTLTDQPGNGGTFLCLEVDNDGLITFDVQNVTNLSGNAGYCVTRNGVADCEDINDLDGNLVEDDFTFTVPVRAGDEFCFWAHDTQAEFTSFTFTCAGAQHNSILPIGVNKVTYVISDGMVWEECGEFFGPNYDTCTIYVAVQDTQAPIAKCTDLTVQIVNGAPVTITPADVDAGSADNCDDVNLAIDREDFSCADIGQTIPVTLTVTDGSGNVSTCTADVFVQEVAVPVIGFCPGSQTFEVDGNCEATVSWITPYVLTGCDQIDMTQTGGPANGSVQGPGTYTVTYEYQDLVCEFEVKVLDVDAPTFQVVSDNAVVPNGGTISLDAASGLCSAQAFWSITGLDDNCSAVQNIDITSTNNSGNTFPVGCTTVTITATDEAGNAFVYTFDVCVDDNEDPIIGCKDLTVYLDDNGIAVVDPLDVLDFVDDDCGIDRFELSQSVFTCDDLGVNAEILTVFDAAQNSASCGTDITVIDTIAPTAVCKDITIEVDANGNASITAAAVDGGSFDNTDCITLSVSQTDFTCADLGDNTVTLTITDDAGLSDQCTATVTVEDNIAPTIANCTANISVSNDEGQCGANVTYTIPTFDDNCDGDNLQGTLVAGPASGDYFPVGTTFVTYTYTDGSGNISPACTFSVTVTDDEDPKITCEANGSLTQENDPGVCSFTMPGIGFDPVFFGDNCPGATIVNDYNGQASLAGETFPVGTTDVTWTVTDVAGNTNSSCTFTITILDTEAPVFNECPQDINVLATLNECDQIVTWAPPYDITDNCDDPFVTSVEEQLIDPVGGINTTIVAQYNYDHTDESTLPAGLQQAQFPVGVSTVLYIATDQYGNADTCEFTVTVTDTEPPSIACPAPQVLGTTCPDAVVPDYTGLGIVSDNCNASATVTQDPAAGTLLSALGIPLQSGASFTVTLTATQDDNPALTDDCSFTVFLDDFTAPIPNENPLPALFSDCGDICVPAPTAQGDCGTTIVGVPTFSQGTCPDGSYFFGIGNYNIVWIYDDGNGNVSQQVQSVVVVADTEAPKAVCNDVEVFLDANGNASITVADIDGGSTDNCGIVDISLSQTQFDCSDAVCEALAITGVLDGPLSGGLPKVIELKALTDVADLSNWGVESANNGNPAVGPELTLSGSISEGEYIYITTPGGTDDFEVYFGFTPDNIIEDGIAFINGDDAIVLYDGDDIYDAAGVIGQDGSGTPWDHLDGWMHRNDGASPNGGNFNTANWTFSGTNALDGASTNAGSAAPYPVADFTAGAISCANVVTLFVEDEAGNVGTCEATVMVTDAIAPDAECNASITVELDANGNASIDVDDIDNGSSDNCAVASREIDVTDFTCADVGANTVTLTVADPSGNTDACQTTVNVVDVTPPDAVCKNITVELNEFGFVYITPADIDGGSTDACGIASLSASQTYFTCADAGNTINVTLTVFDVNGNSNTCIAKVTVEDNIDPVIVCDSDIESCCADQTVSATATDACGIAGFTYEAVFADGTTDSGNTNVVSTDFPVGISTVTFVATDNNGNTSECTVEVNISDDQPPVPVCIDDINVPLGLDGTVTLDAILFDGGSFDIGCNTGEEYQLEFLISVNGSAFAPSYTFDCSNIGDNEVALQVTDCAGNSAICVTGATIQEFTAPFCVANDQSVLIEDDCFITFTAEELAAGTTDNCTDFDDLTITVNGGDSVTVGPDDEGVNTYTLTITDANGNTCTITGTITVEVFQLTCNSITRSLGADGTYTLTDADIEAITGTTGGICVAETIVPSKTLFDCNSVGVNTIVLEITSAQGGVSQCITTVTIVDDSAPECGNIPTFVVELDSDGNGTLPTLDDLDDFITDNCEVVSITYNGPTDFNCDDVGEHTVSVTATDPSGNSTDCSFVIDVQDNETPSFVCDQDHIVVLNSAGFGWITVADILETPAEDNCGIADAFLDITTFDCSQLGFQEVVLTVVDVNGNENTCTTIVEVVANDPALQINALVSSTDETACGANDGTASVDAVTDGNGNDISGNVTYEWSNGETGATVSGLAPGTYTVHVTNTATSCGADFIVTIGEGAGVTITAGCADGDMNTTAIIPVSVDDFNGVQSVQFDVEVADAAIAEVTSASSTGALAGLDASVNGNTVTVSWIDLDQSGESLADGTTIVEIEVTLVGDVGQCSDVSVTDTEVTQGAAFESCDATAVGCEVCVSGASPTVLLAGNVATEGGDNVACLDVNLTGDETGTTQTDTDGDYSFTVSTGGDYTVAPYNNDGPANGITVTDILEIMAHILAKDTLDSEYEKIAADANNNGLITTMDIVFIQAVALGNLPGFDANGTDNTSWNFVPANVVLGPTPLQQSPAYDDFISYDNVTTDQLDGDFIAVKTGDVNGSAATDLCGGNLGNNGTENRAADKLTLRVVDRQIAPGQEFNVEFKAKDFRDITGYQFTLEFDENALTLVDLLPGELDVTKENFNMNTATEGQVPTMWFDVEGANLEDDAVLFTLTFKATANATLSDILSTTSAKVANQAVNREGADMEVELEFVGADDAVFALLQNNPNPFKNQTTIGFILPEASNATLTIMDVSGRVLKSIEGDYTKGYNEVTINRSELGAAGVLYYQLDTEDHTATRKMIVVE